MKWIYLTIIVTTGLVCAFTSRHDGPNVVKRTMTVRQDPAKGELIKRGQYLVTVMGCADCHAPKKLTSQGPVPDMDRFLSGYNSAEPLGPYDKDVVKTGQWVLFNGQNTAAVGPWGVSFAANLTPDATGIGSWSFEQFNTAMRKGKSKGLMNNRNLLPPMPWPNYVNASDADLRAIFAFLKSLKPIANVVPDPIPPAP